MLYALDSIHLFSIHNSFNPKEWITSHNTYALIWFCSPASVVVVVVVFGWLYVCIHKSPICSFVFVCFSIIWYAYNSFISISLCASILFLFDYYYYYICYLTLPNARKTFYNEFFFGPFLTLLHLYKMVSLFNQSDSVTVLFSFQFPYLFSNTPRDDAHLVRSLFAVCVWVESQLICWMQFFEVFLYRDFDVMKPVK